MIRNISFLVLSIAIVVAGYIGVSKLQYLERSVRIFNVRSTVRHFDSRMGRGLEGLNRHGRIEIPYGAGSEFEDNRIQPGLSERNRPDSLQHRFRRSESDRVEVALTGRRFDNGDRHGRDGFRNGKKINLGNVIWFLAVFASFTVIAIYLEKIICLIRISIRKQKST
jgi:hypothetical protein